jgi:hypothetical protein
VGLCGVALTPPVHLDDPLILAALGLTLPLRRAGHADAR